MSTILYYKKIIPKTKESGLEGASYEDLFIGNYISLRQKLFELGMIIERR